MNSQPSKTLLKNASDSIRIGIEDAGIPDVGRRVSAVRNIHAGILLLYKELLRRLSPPGSEDVLVKEKMMPVPSQGGMQFRGVGNKTADTQSIEARFKHLGIMVDWKTFNGIAKVRNAMEHYYSEASEGAVEEVIFQSYVLIRDFMREHLEADPLELLGADVWEKMTEVKDVMTREMADCAVLMKAHLWVDDVVKDAALNYACEDCGSRLMQPEDSERRSGLRCRTCGEITSYLDFVRSAFDNLREVMSGGDGEVVDCPDCGADAYICPHALCADCGYRGNHDCGRCGRALQPNEIGNPGYCIGCGRGVM